MPDAQLQHAESVAGCWITAGWDMNWYDVRPHATEIDALRYAARNPDSCQVYLVPWGKALDFDHRLSRQPEHSDGCVFVFQAARPGMIGPT